MHEVDYRDWLNFHLIKIVIIAYSMESQHVRHFSQRNVCFGIKGKVPKRGSRRYEYFVVLPGLFPRKKVPKSRSLIVLEYYT